MAGAATAGEGGAGLPAAPGSPLVEGFSGLTILRQVGLMIGLAASVAIGFAVVLWSQEPTYQPLAPGLAPGDANQVIEVLRQHNIQYRIDPGSGNVLVPAEKLQDIRLKLAAADVKLDSRVGLEMLDRDQGLGTSQFIETARYRRGLEGELARTIGGMHGVKNARVHIAIPGRSVFVRDNRKPTASVLVDLYPGMRLEPSRVLGIMNLVANSIPEMDRKSVTVVDQRGQLLSPDEDEASNMVMASKQFEYTRRYEEVLTTRIQSILAPVVGHEHFRAEVTADIDFTVVEQTAEQFNPDLPAVRSEQIVGESRLAGGAAAGGIPGALANQPPGGSTVPEVAEGTAAAGAGAADGGPGMREVEQVTKNYELDRTISHTRHETGKVRRLSVAVVLDNLKEGEGAKGSRREWTPEEIARVTALVKDAVGYDPARGDSVNVINSAFAAPTALEELPPPPIWEQPWFWNVVKQALGALFVLLLVFAVLRPIMKNLAEAGTAATAAAGAGAGGMGGLGGAEGLGGERGDMSSDQVTLSGSPDVLLPRPEEGYEAQLNAIKGLVSENPGRVAQVVKQMINADE